MDFMSLFSGLMGGGDKPGAASKQASVGMMGSLQGLLQGLGGMGQGQPTQVPGQGHTLDINAILSLFGGHSNKLKVNPKPTGNFQDEMM